MNDDFLYRTDIDATQVEASSREPEANASVITQNLLYYVI